MSMTAERVPPHLMGLANKLDQQISILESPQDPTTAVIEENGVQKPVFDKDDFSMIQTLGKEDYLAMLKRTRCNLGQADGLSGE